MVQRPGVRAGRQNQRRPTRYCHRWVNLYLSVVDSYGAYPSLYDSRGGKHGFGNSARRERTHGCFGTLFSKGIRGNVMKLGMAKLKQPPHDQLPRQPQETMRKAVRMDQVTSGFVILRFEVLGAVAGQSQAMRSAWVEDMLSLVPPLAFLIASRVVRLASNRRQPYGYHRAIAIGHQAAALALLVMGGLL